MSTDQTLCKLRESLVNRGKWLKLSGKILCYMYLLARLFWELALHKPGKIRKVVVVCDHTTNQ